MKLVPAQWAVITEPQQVHLGGYQMPLYTGDRRLANTFQELKMGMCIPIIGFDPADNTYYSLDTSRKGIYHAYGQPCWISAAAVELLDPQWQPDGVCVYRLDDGRIISHRYYVIQPDVAQCVSIYARSIAWSAIQQLHYGIASR